MKLRTTLFAAAAVVAIAPAAHANEGLYGAIGAGLSYNQPDLDTSGTGAIEFDADGDYDNGVGVYTAIGYAWGNGLRTELEYSFRQNDTRFVDGDGLGFAGFNPLDGELETHAIMANALYDFDTGTVVTPYVGVGAGVASFGLDATSSGGAIGATNLAVSEAGVRRLALQGIAGFSLALADNLDLDLSYRYFQSLRQPSFDGTLAGAAQEIRTKYQNHSLFAGLRWSFASPAPAAPAVQYKDCWDGSSVPVTADCPTQITEDTSGVADPINFTVYFDYDKSNLTPEASNLIREAADRALANDVDQVVVTGNTDTVGSARYNEALSARRGAVVRDALIANGVPADRITVEALGETNLAKPTPDGTREPLNRRSDVTISFQ